MNIRKMAWRNVWRNSRRTLVTVSAMTFALWIMILYSGLMEGYLRDMEGSVLDLEVGDVQIFAPDYRDNPSLYTRIENIEELLAKLDAAGFTSSARLLAFGMAASGDSSTGVSFRGLQLERDAKVCLVAEEVESGRWIEAGDDTGVVLGRRLARTLGVSPGEEIIVLSQAADGSMAYDKYTVRGVLRGIGDATDRSGVFMTEAAFRELFVVADGAHQIIVRRPPDVPLPQAAQAITALAGGLDVKTWRQLMPTISTMLDSARGAIYVMFMIIYLAVAILILNAMLMAVFERVREIGVLKALGVGPGGVLRLMFYEGGIQAGIAIVAGVALAVPGIAYLASYGVNLAGLAGISIAGIAMDPIWRASMNFGVFAGPVSALVVIVSFAVVYPAFKAAWIRPIDAIHHH